MRKVKEELDKFLNFDLGLLLARKCLKITGRFQNHKVSIVNSHHEFTDGSRENRDKSKEFYAVRRENRGDWMVDLPRG
jgi:hypothetical protein